MGALSQDKLQQLKMGRLGRIFEQFYPFMCSRAGLVQLKVSQAHFVS